MGKIEIDESGRLTSPAKIRDSLHINPLIIDSQLGFPLLLRLQE